MKILVTGGAGFIGSHIVDAYLKRGDEVVIIDDLSSGSRNNIESALSQGAKLYECAIQSPEVKEIFESEKPNLINHHAAQKSVRDSVTNPVKDADINLIGLLNILEAGRASGCKKVVFASSGGVVYGEQDTFPATETHSKRPMSPYGVSKMASELYLDYYCMEHGFSAVAMRYANIYGPRQDPDGEAGVVAIFSERMKKSKPTAIFGTGKQTRDFVYVADVVTANLAVDQKVEGFKAFNVGTGVESSVLDLHQILAKISQYPHEVSFEPAKSGEQMRSVLSYGLLQSETGWAPKYDFQSGLKETYQWFVEND